MNQLGVIHPGMVERLESGFYPDTCAIHDRVETQDAYGQPQGGPAANPVAGLDAIPCRIAPVIMGSRETRRPESAWMENKFQIGLNGYYPQITGTQFVKVGTRVFEIEPPPQHDGNGKTTRLLCRIME